ncbi:MAG: hypothetical protein RL097_693 [Candidatus Parcubacteria bacterium]|jgi:hypothetical protein
MFHVKWSLVQLCETDCSPYTNKGSEKSEPLFLVGEPGIEPGPHGPKPRTLPLCYTPNSALELKFAKYTISC